MAVLMAGAVMLLSACGHGSGKQIENPGVKDGELFSKVMTEKYVSPKNNGKLHVDGAKLCDESGQPVRLCGLSTHGIMRVTPYINKDMFLQMRNEWGVNVLRLAMYIQSNDGYAYSESNKNKNTETMEKAVQLATDCDMYAIIDWHILDDKTPMKHIEKAKEFFDKMSRQYADYTNIIYEICNEPNGTEWSEIKEYANQIIPIIRANDPDSVIICGTPEWSQRVDEALADPLDFDNVMYTLHFYAASHKEELRDRMTECADKGLPVFVTEYGITKDSGGMPRDPDEANIWMDTLEKYGISSCMWSFSKTAEACCMINNKSLANKNLSEADFTETGTWFVNMIIQYKNKIMGK